MNHAMIVFLSLALIVTLGAIAIRWFRNRQWIISLRISASTTGKKRSRIVASAQVQRATEAAGSTQNTSRSNKGAIIGFFEVAVISIVCVLVFLGAVKGLKSEIKHLTATSTTASVGTKAKELGSAQDISQSLVNSAKQVERNRALEYDFPGSFPYSDEDGRDFFVLGDVLGDHAQYSARVAWNKIAQLCPEFIGTRAMSGFIESEQTRYIDHITVEDLKNGLTVEQIIVAWPTKIKGWVAVPRPEDDPHGWTFAAEYSDSLRAEYLRTAEGKSYGTNVTAKAVIMPSMLEKKPFDRMSLLTLVIATLVTYWGVYFILNGIWQAPKTPRLLVLWAVLPAVVFGCLWTWAVISRCVGPTWANRSETVILISVFCSIFVYAFCLGGYESSFASRKPVGTKK